MLLPADRPLLAATLRALPAGMLLLLMCRRMPRGEWWWKSWILGILTSGAFFALLFIASYRLPGGVAAIVGGIQPLVVALLASRVLHERLTARVVAAGMTGLLGVSLITLQAQARLDAIGILAAVGGALSMATGIVLSKKWGQPASPLATTSWQLITGGLTLCIVMLAFEGLPATSLTSLNLVGYTYLAGVGTAFAYVMWFRGISRLPASTTAFLGLLSPVVAILLGWLVAGEAFVPMQILGIVLVLGSISAAIATKGVKRSAGPGSSGLAPPPRQPSNPRSTSGIQSERVGAWTPLATRPAHSVPKNCHWPLIRVD